MDEPDEDEDEQIMLNDVPFTADKDFLLKHGTVFSLTFDEDTGVAVNPE